ncbi:mitochondrial fission factor homolog B isoform X3 [Conger conger]|uniref:mitochondrial fission factor homolog B isoform X3 n=1 Tax=Conger conger TaxID=82655 RepID=UPI002A5AF595|nr:mitochondrial fission factor homolog B isoform X3 [Conger conger]
MAEIDRIHYEIEYTEGISQRMRIPEKLQVAPDDLEAGPIEARHSVLMHVPERILVAGDSQDSQYPRPRDLDLIQSTPLESLALKTPPRVLTLNDRPLDFMERSVGLTQAGEEGRAQVRIRRERSASENTLMHPNGQLIRHEPMLGLSTMDTSQEGIPDDMAVGDASSLRRQILKLNRRLLLLEEENKERTKREMVMYSITVAFWIINSWIWLRR